MCHNLKISTKEKYSLVKIDDIESKGSLNKERGKI